MVHSGYSQRPVLKDVRTVINFDMPSSYNQYKEAALMVNDETGSVFTFV
jgi:hypothetical protein